MSKLLKSSYYFPLQVTIDDREPTTLENEFRKVGNMIIHRQRLTAGDYLFDRDLSDLYPIAPKMRFSLGNLKE